MQGTFDLLEKLGDTVEANARTSATKAACLNLEGHALARSLGQQPSPLCLVDDIAKGAARAPRGRLQLHSDVLIQGQCRSHITMISL